jgi:hypothetical protein
MSETENTKKYDELKNTFFSLLPSDILTRLALFISPPPVYTYEVQLFSIEGGMYFHRPQFNNKEDALNFKTLCLSLGKTDSTYCITPYFRESKVCNSIEDAISQMENVTIQNFNGKGIPYYASLLRKKIEEDKRELKKQKIEK